MKHVSLFSGVGGIDLAAEWAGFTTVAFCENDRYCQQVLNLRWPGVPMCGDIHDLHPWNVEEGVCYCGSCGMNDNEQPICETWNLPKKQSHHEGLNESALTVEQQSFFPEVSPNEDGKPARGSVGLSICEEITGRTLAGVNGCEGMETQTGKTDTATTDTGDTKRIGFLDGDEGYLREITTPVRNAVFNRTKPTNSEHTISNPVNRTGKKI